MIRPVHDQDDNSAAMRIDKWLWCARFYKTRALASAAVRKGRVRVNNKQVKPASAISPGAHLSLRSGPYEQRITVMTLVKNRQGAVAAAQLYQEDPESIAKREQLAEQLHALHASHPGARSRPTKRERRQLAKIRKRIV